MCWCYRRCGWVRPAQVKRAFRLKLQETQPSPTNPSHEGAIIRAANMSVWNAPAIYRNTRRVSKYGWTTGGSRTCKVLLNLSHLACLRQNTQLALQKNKRPSCVWQPHSCADPSRRPPTESSRASRSRRHGDPNTWLANMVCWTWRANIGIQVKNKKGKACRTAVRCWEACVFSDNLNHNSWEDRALLLTAFPTIFPSSSSTVQQETLNFIPFTISHFGTSHHPSIDNTTHAWRRSQQPHKTTPEGIERWDFRDAWNVADEWFSVKIGVKLHPKMDRDVWMIQTVIDATTRTCFHNVNINVPQLQFEPDQMDGCRLQPRFPTRATSSANQLSRWCEQISSCL